MFRILAMTLALGVVVVFGGVATPAQAEWKRAESERFIVYSDGDERSLREFVQKLETFDRTLRFVMNRPVEEPPLRKLPIYLVRQQRDIRQVWPDVPETIYGLYTVSDDDIWAIAVRSRDDDSTLLHEYAHHFMLQHFPQGYPAWFVEGFAEYFSSVDFRSGRVAVGLPDENAVGWLLGVNRWIPMEDVLTKRYWEIRDGRETYYPVSWIMTHYFLSDPDRKAQLGQYLIAVAAGVEGRQAMETATGQTLEQLERSLRTYLRGRAMSLVVTYPFPQAQITVTALPPSADTLLLLNQRLKRLSRGGEPNPQLLDAVRASASRYPDDPLAQRTLARAEIVLGEPSRAASILDGVLSRQEDDVEALQLQASVKLIAAEGVEDLDQYDVLHREARALLGRAYAVDQNNFTTLLLLAQSRRTARGFPNDNDEETLWAAHELAPQLPGIRFDLAQVLIIRGKPEQAIALLRPLLNDPHDASVAQFAQRITAEALRRSAPPSTQATEPEPDEPAAE